MTPCPSAVAMSPPTSPNNMQQTDNNQDPFVAYGAGQAQPQQFNQQQAPAPAQKQPGNVDPWAAMSAPPAQAPPAPAMAPPVAPAPPAAPMPMMQAPVLQAHLTPPPAMVTTDSAWQVPPSPMGDVSVIGQMNNAAAAQPLQPAPQPMTMQPVSEAPPAQAPPAAPAAANPFDFGAVAASVPQAPPPAAMPPQAPPSPADPNAAAPNAAATHAAPVAQQYGMISPPVSPVPAGAFSPNHTQQYADPFGYAFSPMTSPVTSPVTSPNGSPGNGMMVPSAMPSADPFGAFGGQIPPTAAGAPAGMPMMPGIQAPAQPLAQRPVAPQAALNADPFAAFGGQPAAAPADPFGSSGGAMVASAPATDDPFGIFGAATPAPAPVQMQAPPRAPAPLVAQQQQAPSAAMPPQEEDPWAAAGFGQMVSQQPQANLDPRLEQNQQHSVPSSNNNNAAANQSISYNESEKQEEVPIALDSNNLPSEGDYYEARINARSLGAMFYTARNVEDTLYYKMPRNVIAALASRPVVAYVAEGSAAYNSGIHLGHVVLSVNGQEVQDPEYCAAMIRSAQRPMTLRCYVPPNLELTLNEGRHLVKYDNKDLEAPCSAIEWKRKYVVIGGIVTKPWIMNMFYKKSDYDIAVKEAHAGHKISVKVKQFDLRGARIILKGKDGRPNWVDYPSERKQWHYVTILPNKGYPIKISSDSLEGLEPVYSAVRRFVRNDMEARYQLKMEESFGDTAGQGAVRAVSSRSNNSNNSTGRNTGGVGMSHGTSNPGFGGFGDDAPPSRPDSYWRR